MHEALNMVKAFLNAGQQTKMFILVCVIYMALIVWTTVQAYARLEYSRSDEKRPIIIQTSPQTS